MDVNIGVFSNRGRTPGDVLEFQGETSLLLRCDRNIGIPFPMKQGNRPSSPVEEGENVGLLELWCESRCSSLMGTGISGDFLSCIKGVKYTFKREPGIPLQTLLWKRASSCSEGEISCFFSSCGGKLGVPVNLRWRPHGPDCVSSEKSGLFPCCEGHVGIPLQ